MSRRVPKNVLQWGGDVRLVATTLLLLACAPISATEPLYEDPTGWEIVAIKSGLDLSEPYMMTREQAREIGIGSPEVPGLLYIAKDPLNIYAFVIAVPENKRLSWPVESEITIFYEEDGDTLNSTSVEFFVCGEYPTPYGTLPGKVMSSHDMAGAVPIPNDWIFKTPNNNPVVFARFPFGKEPHSLLKVTVANVTVTDRR
jgi:hypothetical protein